MFETCPDCGTKLKGSKIMEMEVNGILCTPYLCVVCDKLMFKYAEPTAEQELAQWEKQ